MVSSGNFVSLCQELGRSGGGRHAYWVCRTDLLYGVLVVSFSSLHLLFGPGQQGRREGLSGGLNHSGGLSRSLGESKSEDKARGGQELDMTCSGDEYVTLSTITLLILL
jgi:hypothetical protein